MPTHKPYARIAITLPPEDLDQADALALRLDRSRSWVIAEALRQFVAQQAAAAPPLDPSRRAQLYRDSALTPAQRVREAEVRAQVDATATRPMEFDTYEAFAAWRRAQRRQHPAPPERP